MGQLDGRIALIAGASGGLGKAVATAFAREGATLVLVGRNENALAATVSTCRQAGVRVDPARADVRRWDQIKHLIHEAERHSGPIDVLVNATGVVTPIGPLVNVDPGDWGDSVQVNLIGAFHLCRAVAPHMSERRRGKIILFSGGGATAPFPRFSAYAAAKAGVVRLAETLAEEMKDLNVQVNAVAPGLVDTQLQDAVIAAGPSAGAQLKRVKDARETGAGSVPVELVAQLAVFLASAESGTLTGKLISAPHDPWREWQARGEELNATPLFTLRRLDPFTLATVAEAPT